MQFEVTIATAGALALLLSIVRPPRRMTPGRSVAEIRARLDAESAGPILELLSGHGAPGHPLEASEAHRVMREHLDCAAASCPRKAAAFGVLVEAGHVKPRAAALVDGHIESGRHPEPVAVGL
ncbi:hypothetical protein [Nocardia miyunensis]|uniref:hypothetical protein n=1 Tax=Nocardia miyunensis TaxID=282684 RepID=UPI000831D3FD|nr:hypothetical protein [Nocardia miyunensis]